MLRSLSVIALLLCSIVAQAADDANKESAAKIEAELDRRTEVQYLDTQLQDVMLDLELRHHLTIRGDWEAITAAIGKPAKELTITMSLKDVSLASALAHVLTPHKLTWAIDNDVLLFTSLEKEGKYVQTKVYKIGDFATDPEAVQNVIESTIEITSWQSNGGDVGAIALYGDTKSLVVTHTARTQRRIAQLINDLRASKADGKK